MSDLTHQHIVRRLNVKNRRRNYLRKIEQRIISIYEMFANTLYFMRLGVRLRTAIYLARNIK